MWGYTSTSSVVGCPLIERPFYSSDLITEGCPRRKLDQIDLVNYLFICVDIPCLKKEELNDGTFPLLNAIVRNNVNSRQSVLPRTLVYRHGHGKFEAEHYYQGYQLSCQTGLRGTTSMHRGNTRIPSICRDGVHSADGQTELLWYKQVESARNARLLSTPKCE